MDDGKCVGLGQGGVVARQDEVDALHGVARGEGQPLRRHVSLRAPQQRVARYVHLRRQLGDRLGHSVAVRICEGLPRVHERRVGSVSACVCQAAFTLPVAVGAEQVMDEVLVRLGVEVASQDLQTCEGGWDSSRACSPGWGTAGPPRPSKACMRSA